MSARRTLESPANQPSALDPGLARLRFEICNAATGNTVVGVWIRLCGRTRCASLTAHAGEVDAVLRPDCYEIGLNKTGFCRTHLEPVRLEPGQVIDLGVVTMRPTEASLSGRLIVAGAPPVDSASDDPEYRVELRGAGRRCCPDCGHAPADETHDARLGSACPECGFGDEFSRRLVLPGGSFSFTHLAPGPYLLSASHPVHAPLGVSVELNLGPDEERWQDLALEPMTFVTLRAHDSMHRPFRGTWQRPGAAEPPHLADFRIHLRAPGGLRASGSVRPTWHGSVVLYHEDLEDPVVSEEEVEQFVSEWDPLAPIDHPRTDGEPPWPEEIRPRPPFRTIRLEALEDGRLRLGPLPALDYEATLRWANWREEFALPLRSRSDRDHTVVFTDDASASFADREGRRLSRDEILRHSRQP